jgi:hypothetical protein
VFIDGDLTLATDIYYLGKGTLIVSGDVSVPNSGGVLLPGAGSHDPDSYPEVNALGIATPGNIDVYGNTSSNPSPSYAVADMAGAFFAQGRFTVSKNLTVRGSILSNVLSFEGANVNLLTDPDLPDNLPPSLPGGDDVQQVFMTRWHDAGSSD